MPTAHSDGGPPAEPRQRETGYYLLLGSLLLLIGIFPFLSEYESLLHLLDLFVVLVLCTVIIAIYRRGSARLWVVGATLIALGLLVANQFTAEGGAIDLSRYLVSALALAGAAWVMLRDVMRKEPVTTRKICGAICVYLMLGVIWAFGYAILDLSHPESFAIQLDSKGRMVDFVYFSFITLSTLGYGDIIPATAGAKSLASLEAIAGQFYLTILVARLVGLHISQGEDT